MSFLEEKRTEVSESLVVVDQRAAYKQRRQMLMALAILFVALVLVLVKDWQFWFPSDTAEAVPATQTNSPSLSTKAQPKAETPQTAPPIHGKQKSAAQPGTSESMPELAGPTITATQRRVLPPLEVEVIAGGPPRTLQPKNNSIKVDLQASQPATPASSTTVETEAKATLDASSSVRLSPETAKMVATPVEPSYPLLARQMRVQGAVVLQALIGRAGNIEDLHVLSGPAILSSAAMEAVRQWRFKPYFQAGRAMDTEARITVNFTISTF